MFRWPLYRGRVSGPPPVRLGRWGSWWVMRLQSHYVRGWTLPRFCLGDCCPRGHLRRSSFAPAVAHVGPGRGRFPFPWCCLASLVMFGGRQSPPPTNHRWPGSCARRASRNAFTLQVRRLIRVCTHRLIRNVKELVWFASGRSPRRHQETEHRVRCDKWGRQRKLKKKCFESRKCLK